MSEKTQNGVSTFGVIHEPTLPYSPYQNGKAEVFWGQIEGRLLAMLEGVREPTLDLFNEATQAYVELEYHRSVHDELGTTPLKRYLETKDVGRPSPTGEELKRAFRRRSWRKVRHGDGTVSVENVRYELPSRLRRLTRVCVAWARWDLSTVDVIDRESGTVLATLLPQDKTKNASAERRTHEQLEEDDGPEPPPSGVAPLLRKLMAEYRRSGLPPAYLPKPVADAEEESP
jgi:hypothetical protein